MSRAIVAIDGPAGSGKSTVARMVADSLGYLYIDSGAMYRAVAWAALREGLDASDAESVSRLANTLEIRFERTGDAQKVWANATDVTEAIRTPEVTRLVSPISAIHDVRTRMVQLQRGMGNDGGVVMEGRDIGTVVFPQAQVKVFLTASVEERARRRTLEMKAKGMPADEAQVAAEIRKRDEMDSTRSEAPLRKADDAIVVDTDGKSIEQVVAEVIGVHDSRASTT